MTKNIEEVRKLIWEGCVPIQFHLTPNEVIVPQPPPPYFIMVPRNSYLPLISHKLYQHFASSAPVIGEEMWFEYNSTPIKWHYPVGVLYDLLVTSSLQQNTGPWKIDIHFQAYPSEHILRCPDEETIRRQYFHILKEANHIKFGDGNRVNGLNKADSDKLWEGIKNSKFKLCVIFHLLLEDFYTFWRANEQLMTKPENLKNIPLRILEKGVLIQEPLFPFDKEGNSKTLKQALEELGPAWSEKESLVMVQGIFPSLETSITWLYENCCQIDNFLYIILCSKNVE